MEPKKYWSDLSDSHKEELKVLWQNSSEPYQDNYNGFSAWLLDNYNIILDNKDNTNKDNIKIIFGVVLFIITIIVITSVAYNASINKDNDYYSSDYDNNYNNYNNKTTYYCDSGYTLINNQCHKKDIINATEEYQCYSGTLRGTECITEITTLAYKNETCSFGYTLMGSDCIAIGTRKFTGNCGFNETYNSANNMCYRILKPTIEYKCYSGVLKNNSCVTEIKVPASVVYTCPIGYTQNYSVCEKDITIPANIR